MRQVLRCHYGTEMHNVRVIHHRNGVAGNGYHTVQWFEGRHPKRSEFMAVVFPERGHVAILGPDDGGVFSYRYEDYDRAVRKAVHDFEVARSLGGLEEGEATELLYGREA